MTAAVKLFCAFPEPRDLPRLERLYLPRLHTDERASYSGFGVERRRLDWLSGRALALEALALLVPGADDAGLRTRPGGGIEYRDGNASLYFSLSHSHGLVALAAADAPLGVDVERLRERRLMDDVGRFFGPEEATHVRDTQEAGRLPLFYRYWTLKEAVCKASGLPLLEGLVSARFDLSEDAPAFKPVHPAPPGPWRFWTGSVPDGWRLAVALRSGGAAPVFEAFDLPLPGPLTPLELDDLSSFAAP